MRSAVLAGCRPRAAGIARLIRSTTTSQCAGGRSFSRTNHQREQSLSSSSSSSSSDHDSSNVVGGIDLSTLTNDSVVFSGIQPTGVPHIGNYFGALRQWKHMQDVAPPGAKLFFCIVDLHAITMPQDAHILQRKKAEMFAALMAIGLDPERSTIFYQSEVMAHSELMWILSCTASMGYLNRMTQWKTKMQLSDDAEGLDRDVAQRLKLGLFSYPVLQAADILVHRATHVPVGADQRQHLEFARECVSNFNHAYDTKCLVSPQTITTSSPRIMSLRHPTRKMSKSSPVEMSRIDITARPKVIRQRINSATTDMLNEVTWDPEARPGVANLLGIIAQCGYFSGSRTATAQDVAADFAPGETLGSLKKMTADALCHELEGVADRYHEILGLKGGKHIQELQELGAHRARESARETMHMVRDAVGLGAPRYRARLPQTKEELLD